MTQIAVFLTQLQQRGGESCRGGGEGIGDNNRAGGRDGGRTDYYPGEVWHNNIIMLDSVPPPAIVTRTRGHPCTYGYDREGEGGGSSIIQMTACFVI